MSKQERIFIWCIAASLLILPIANLAHVAVMLEIQLAMRHVYTAAVSWSLVWLAGLALAVVVMASKKDNGGM